MAGHCNGPEGQSLTLLPARCRALTCGAVPRAWQVHFGSKEVEAAFGVIADAFLFFDEDGDGYLTKEEIMHALSKGHGLENAGGDVIRQRFGEEGAAVLPTLPSPLLRSQPSLLPCLRLLGTSPAVVWAHSSVKHGLQLPLCCALGPACVPPSRL